jgi:5-methylcytosine-specific restriction endonuclease McrA
MPHCSIVPFSQKRMQARLLLRLLTKSVMQTDMVGRWCGKYRRGYERPPKKKEARNFCKSPKIFRLF